MPTLYTALTTGEAATNPAVYGEFVHPFVLAKDEIVEIVVNNLGKLVLYCHVSILIRFLKILESTLSIYMATLSKR